LIRALLVVVAVGPILHVEPFFGGKNTVAKGVKGIDDSGRLNRGLWDLAEQFSLN
jgi:hypothetical protein